MNGWMLWIRQVGEGLRGIGGWGQSQRGPGEGTSKGHSFTC